MVKFSSTFALLALVAAGVVFSAPPDVVQGLAPADTQNQETARRRAAVKDALVLVSKARDAYQAKRYTDAVEQYRNALSVLPQAPATEKLRNFVSVSLSDALIARAIDYRSVGRTEEAVEFLKEAVQLAPDNQRAKTELVYTQDAVRTNPALSPEHVGAVEEVTRLLTLGYSYLNLGKYDQAIETFRSVAQYDEYNVAAKRGIEMAEKFRAEAYKSAHDTTRAKMLADVGETWESAMNHSSEPVGLAADSAGMPAEDSLSGEVESAHASAIKQMHVREFTLDNNTIDEAAEVLRNYIKRFESSGTRSSRHIDVYVNFGSEDSPARRAAMTRRVSVHLTDLSMQSLLDEVARLYGLQYYYVPMGVEFSFEGKDYGRLVDRAFSVPAHFFDADEDEKEDDEDDAFGSSNRMAVKRRNPVKVLREMGINFPEGANAVYRASTRKLIVRNTVQNLAKIEELLNAPPPNQWIVVMNVITIEVEQSDLEDLGFDWLFNMHLGGDMFMGGMDGAASSVVGLPNLSSAGASRGGPQGGLGTGGLRSIDQLSGAKDLTSLIQNGSVRKFASTRESSSPSIFGIRGVWAAADVTMMMRGLSQKKGVDMLHNPRIVLNPGNEEVVTIANVREFFYPESYDPPQIPKNTGNNNWDDDYDDDDYDDNDYNDDDEGVGGSSTVVTGAHPTDFVRFGYSEENNGGIGSIIQIHKAEPSADGQSINLALTTTVNDFEGFIDWGSPIYSALTSGNGRGEPRRVILSQNHIYQPIFKRRMVNSTVSVANGGVLVMGGMREARIVRYEDKVPVLGDLPLVGRLFRSSGESKTQKALLIFAKVDIVDPTGRSINGIETSGPEE